MMKYRLTDKTKVYGGHTLHKIEYTNEWLESMGLEELKGGWIESEKNLDHEGNALVCGNALVYGDACVYGNACVYGDARMYGDACVFGDACVNGDCSDNIIISTQEQWEQYNIIRSKYLSEIRALARMYNIDRERERREEQC